MIELREYQQRAIDQLYQWFAEGNDGNPCLVLPTGSGKSHIVAALCKDALQNWPETTILMLTHVKELIEQNAEKMRQHWPNAPLGIYSAGMGKRQLGEPITFAGIQSIRNRAAEIGHIDLVIIDEAHLVGHRDQGGYRKLLNDLTQINPALRVIGLTATPYRLGHGLITDKPAIFDALIEPVSIEELVYKGYLSRLSSKPTTAKLDASGVHKRGGEYIESELQAAVDTDPQNIAVVDEVIRLAGDRKAWLFFCAGVSHAQHIAEILNSRGVKAECVTGQTPKKERERILSDYKAGKIRALTNANVFTTGFDYPDIDLIPMLRPTLSPGLYVQMAGRGMRIKSHTDHCLVLDFAGVVAMHGPITAVRVPGKKSGESGDMPSKTCDNCSEICPASATACPACGSLFPPPERPALSLRNDDIMGIDGIEMEVTDWRWREHISQTSGKRMLAVSYYGGLSDPPVTEYLTILHEGYAQKKALRTLLSIAQRAGASLSPAMQSEGEDALPLIVSEMMASRPPSALEYKRDGRFYRVIDRRW